jgi:hypothetical protein
MAVLFFFFFAGLPVHSVASGQQYPAAGATLLYQGPLHV